MNLEETLKHYRKDILDVLSVRKEDQPEALGVLLRNIYNTGYQDGWPIGYMRGWETAMGVCNE